MKEIMGLLFDLDGVIVDTAKYHYFAWKKLADELGIAFGMNDNERLKGVSRMRSLEIILEIGGMTMSNEEKDKKCSIKNKMYLDYIHQLKSDEVLPGVKIFLTNARKKGYKIALGSASKNSRFILEKLEIVDYFDAIVDGTVVSRAKPDPEVFIRGAEFLKLPCEGCLVFEDASAGIEAAHNAGMLAVGIGTIENLPKADLVLPGFNDIVIEDMIKKLLEV